MMRSALAAAAAVVACATAGACSTSSAGSGARTGLAKAMASVSGSGAAAASFQYGDLARMRKLKLIDPAAITDRSKRLFDPRWASVTGTGLGQLAAAVAVLPQLLGVNAFSADTAVAIGQPPNTAIRVDGTLSADAVQDKLTKLGAKPRKFGATTGLSLGADNAFDAGSKLTSYGIVTGLNQVVVTDHSLAASPNAATLQLVRGNGKSLLDTGRFGDVAGCLGDVIAAELVATKTGSTTTLVAAGVRTPASATATVTEVLCLLPIAGSKDAVQKAVAKNLTVSSTTASGIKLDTVLDKVTVDTSSSLVRATLILKSGTAPGFLMKAIDTRDYRVWDGSCSPAAATSRHC